MHLLPSLFPRSSPASVSSLHRPLHLPPGPLKSKHAPSYQVVSVRRIDCGISRPMATPELRFLIPVSQSPRTNRMKRAGLVVEWAWRFQPQNGCEIARALGIPFKINGRINSKRGSQERRGKYTSAYHPLSTSQTLGTRVSTPAWVDSNDKDDDGSSGTRFPVSRSSRRRRRTIPYERSCSSMKVTDFSFAARVCYIIRAELSQLIIVALSKRV